MRIFARTLPIRAVVDIIERDPQVSVVEDEPLVYFRAKVKFVLSSTEKATPLWVEGQVQVNADHTLEMMWLAPQYGSIQGTMVNAILDPYRDVILQAAEHTDLAILGVVT
jgi:hypothetical protein